uniref:Uncharacterized protein n=1 Tax=Mycena chlorophos TaxID=658473 RepID=A0ABQ0LFR4_MYCCL|nr:predicted protein [Mycena chlorophos]
MQKDLPRPSFVPEAGAFALMTLDPIASLEYLNDPEAIEAGQKLEFKDYAVYVTGGRQLLNPAAKYREERIHFILPAPPGDDLARCIDSAMSMPIFPAVDRDHPPGRAPLRPSGLFEWQWPSYVSAFIKTIVRCANEVTVDPKQCGLDAEGQLQFIKYRNQDQRVEETSTAPANAPSHDLAISAGPLPASPSVLVNPVIGEPEPELVVQNDPEEEGAVVASLLAMLLQHEASEDVPAVKFTHNLSRIKELNDPRGFFEEVKQLAEIARQSKLRAADKKNMAAESDAARYDEKTAQLLRGHRSGTAQGT